MPSRSPERGRTRSRQQNLAFAKSQTPSRVRSAPRRTISPRSRSRPRSRTPSRTPSARGDRRNGVGYGRERSRSPSRSATRNRSGGRAGRRFRERSYTRSPSRGSPLPKSSKVGDRHLGHEKHPMLNICRLWWRSLRKTSMKAIYEKYLVHMVPFGSLVYQ